jgi:hypothetical protein
MSKLEIPYEVADGITLAVLEDYREYLQSELDQWFANPKSPENPDGYWMHPEDIVNNRVVIDALDTVIRQFKV